MRNDEARTVRKHARVTTLFGDTGRVVEVEDSGTEVRFRLADLHDRDGLPLSGTLRVPARYALAIEAEIERAVTRAD